MLHHGIQPHVMSSSTRRTLETLPRLLSPAGQLKSDLEVGTIVSPAYDFREVAVFMRTPGILGETRSSSSFAHTVIPVVSLSPIGGTGAHRQVHDGQS